MKIDIRSFSASGIAAATAELTAYVRTLESKVQQAMDELEKIGLDGATTRFSYAPADLSGDITVSSSSDDLTFTISANGKEVCFIEFGAGVYYNGSGIYPEPLPDGIVGIGQYGKGYGKYDTWTYMDANGVFHDTHGNQAEMPMYYTKKEIAAQVKKVFTEVFHD